MTKRDVDGNPKGTGSGKSPDEHNEQEKINDKEWELRVGRAIYVLRATVPRFFESGLTSSVETRGDSGGVDLEPTSTDDIYSKFIRLTYTPPVRLPAPFPQTLQVEGLALYHASAVLLRTSLQAMYSDCTLNMTSINVISSGHRERKLKIGLTIDGHNRVTGTKAVWDVMTTYTFSPVSGLVLQHDIDSINPAPLFDSMRSSVLRLMGLASPGGSGVGPAKTCTSSVPSSKDLPG
jgi:hypothetical protein